MKYENIKINNDDIISIGAFKCSDGKIFEYKKEAENYNDFLKFKKIFEELDPNDFLNINISEFKFNIDEFEFIRYIFKKIFKK